MAGSIKAFVYTDDPGNDYGIKLDESNTEAVNGGTQDYVIGLSIVNGLPRNIKPRELFYTNQQRTRTIRCVALTQAIYQAVIEGTAGQTIPDPIDPANPALGLIRANGERRKLFVPADSGLVDGDAT